MGLCNNDKTCPVILQMAMQVRSWVQYLDFHLHCAIFLATKSNFSNYGIRITCQYGYHTIVWLLQATIHSEGMVIVLQKSFWEKYIHITLIHTRNWQMWLTAYSLFYPDSNLITTLYNRITYFILLSFVLLRCLTGAEQWHMAWAGTVGPRGGHLADWLVVERP